MEISTKQTSAGLLVSLVGALDEFCSETMKEQLETGLRQGGRFIVIDFDRVTKVSALGLRCLLPFVQQIQQQGKQIILINLDAMSHGIIKNTGFRSCVIIKTNLLEALSFADADC